MMKSKLSWIAFIPLFAVAVFCKLAPFILPEGTVFGMSDLLLDYVFLGAVVILFLITVLFCLTDKKISAYYLPRRNIFAGVFGILLAVAFAADGANEIFHIFSSGVVEALSLIEAVLLLLSAVILVVLGLTHFFRAEGSKGFVLLNIMPALLCAVRMITCFVQFTTISLRVADVTSLACYIFAAMFFFNYAVALSFIKVKNAVKSCFIFGIPAVAALIACAVPKLIFTFDMQDLISNLGAVEMILMGVYILSFTIELTAFVPTADRVIISEGDDDDELPDGVEMVPDLNPEDIVVRGEADDSESDQSEYLMHTDTEHYLYVETQQVNDNPADNPDTVNDTEGYLTQVTVDDGTDDRPANYEKRLDDIDKLILEITSQSD